MINKIIHGKYFYHVVIGVILIVTIYIIWNKKTKDNQYELLLGAIGEASTTGGGYADMGKTGGAFDPKIWVGKPWTPLWDKQENILEKIYNKGNSNSWNPVDDEQAVVDLFKKFANRRQISYISDEFYKKYKKDLYTYLNSFMENQAVGTGKLGSVNYMVRLKDIINGIPA